MLCDVRSAQSGGIIDFQQRSFDLQKENRESRTHEVEAEGADGWVAHGLSWAALR